jgi:trimeric autotransporter adhesin
MKLRACFVIVSFLSAVVYTTLAQTAASSLASTQVPRLIKFSGVAQDETHKPVTGVVGVTFLLYTSQQGGSPLWIETQNVKADATGHYTAMLGSASAEGVPLELFSSGDAQWLGVQVQGQPEQARILLVSVPYALKAHEAETLSGRSISDFVLLNKTASAVPGASKAPGASDRPGGSSSPPATNNGPTNFVGTNATQIVGVTQKGTGVGLSATSTTHAAVAGTITGTSNTGVYGLASNNTKGSNAAGVTGQANTETGPGVQGVTTSPKGFGVQGVVNSSAGGTAVQGLNNATSGVSNGVYGQTASKGHGSAGVTGIESAKTGQVDGVNGSTNSTTNLAAGVVGLWRQWIVE